MMILHGYWRSSASYRVRIALGLTGVEVEHRSVNLKAGEQLAASHADVNAQPFVPVLELEDGTKLTQSLAIIDFLDAAYRNPALMPPDPILRSKIMSASLVIASDVAPVANLSVLKFLRAEYGQDDAGVKDWITYWIERGFTALETIAQTYEASFFVTEVPSLFECCLIPQVYNANRYGVDMSQFPKLSAINEACLALPSFDAARPENQIDAIC